MNDSQSPSSRDAPRFVDLWLQQREQHLTHLQISRPGMSVRAIGVDLRAFVGVGGPRRLNETNTSGGQYDGDHSIPLGLEPRILVEPRDLRISHCIIPPHTYLREVFPTRGCSDLYRIPARHWYPNEVDPSVNARYAERVLRAVIAYSGRDKTSNIVPRPTGLSAGGAQPALGPNVFRVAQKKAYVQFNGQPVPTRTIAGNTYIACLLRERRLLSYRDLDRMVNGISSTADGFGQRLSDQELIDNGIIPRMVRDRRLPLTDVETIKKVREAKEGYTDLLEDAIHEEKKAEVERLKLEIASLDRYLGTVVDVHGRVRTTSDEAMKQRGKIRTAIKRTIEGFERSSESASKNLAVHLKQSLEHSATGIEYVPDSPNITWDVQIT
jgi:hypothetical protein